MKRHCDQDPGGSCAWAMWWLSSAAILLSRVSFKDETLQKQQELSSVLL